MVLCKACGFSNLERDHFCGKCGQAIAPVSEQEPVIQVTEPEPVKVEDAATSSKYSASTSPIFDLSAEPDPSSTYLLDDEEPRTHRGAHILLTLVIILFFGAAAFVAYQKYYFVPPFSANVPAASVPAFAYEHTPPMLKADAQLEAMSADPALPSRKVVDQIALENISHTMRNMAANERLAQSDTPQAEGARLLAEGEKYLYGRGVPSNCKFAVKNFEDAADKGNARAMAHLGSLYGSGRCVKFSRTKAYEWFAKAKNANPDNTWYEASMDMLWRNMSRRERSAMLK